MKGNHAKTISYQTARLMDFLFLPIRGILASGQVLDV